ncbi:MAG: ribosome biogenesis GTPase YlqF [Cycloclasticus sp.]|jgi:ribosome biogenesis GTPase A|nr:ribosome biogenesis GTPase YlqF [Cycloclasticus sp.]MDF1688244.1 ribosome biogenesis GTPase YlqF [Cycloclasticus sp.]MEE4290353.1 ribosome biogenesis GTPase YlqF [Cycloclasticus sp.]
MSINWYPGHMHKAQKEIKKRLPEVDMFIEVLDARIPYSSENPMLANIRGDKPCIKILNKTDLAESDKTQDWQQYLEQNKNTKTLALNLNQPNKSEQIFSLCKKLVPNKGTKISPITCLITGIPNVGKSTLINTLAGRTIAKTGNEPAVTQTQQRIDLGNNIILFDTPGLLWPKVENEDSGYRLAVTGAIKDTAIEYDDIAYYAAEYLLKEHLDALMDRYSLEEKPRDETTLLEAIGRKRGALVNGGRVNLNKTSAIFIHEFRSGALGSITLETPKKVEAEIAKTEKIIAEKTALKAARKKNWKNKK